MPIYIQYMIIHIQISGENATSRWIQSIYTFVYEKSVGIMVSSVDLLETWIRAFPVKFKHYIIIIYIYRVTTIPTGSNLILLQWYSHPPNIKLSKYRAHEPQKQ